MTAKIAAPMLAVIVNPAAHKGGAAKCWPAIRAELSVRLGPFEPLFTAAPGHATTLARPGAKFDDGVLDLIEMGDISRLGMLFGVMPKLYSGAHVRHRRYG